jgi:hypothetical protein
VNVYVVRCYVPYDSYSSIKLVTLDYDEAVQYCADHPDDLLGYSYEMQCFPLAGVQKFRLSGPYKEDVIVNNWELTPVSARVRKKFWL